MPLDDRGVLAWSVGLNFERPVSSFDPGSQSRVDSGFRSDLDTPLDSLSGYHDLPSDKMITLGDDEGHRLDGLGISPRGLIESQYAHSLVWNKEIAGHASLDETVASGDRSVKLIWCGIPAQPIVDGCRPASERDSGPGCGNANHGYKRG